MKKRLLLILLCFAVLLPFYAGAADGARAFAFGVMDFPELPKDMRLQAAIDRIRPGQLAFVVVNGVRAKDESCADALYSERKSLLEESDKPLFLSMAGNDWIGCKNEEGQDIRRERLQRLREMLFDGDASFGMVSLPLVRQSSSSRYSDFSENIYWQYNDTLFATLHLPAGNNHYLSEAGGNNEFEERQLANRDWLLRVFTLARRSRLGGIVIFCDGNPFGNHASRESSSRDGFREIRQLLTRLTTAFSGKVLLVHSEASSPNRAIAWKGNLGVVAAGSQWLEIRVNPGGPYLFSVNRPLAARRKARQDRR
ncbi:MAG: hypothetical protein LBM56_01820 [Burkholderiaceae bacterium]|jgi:hypothetical protein|nr:hypothetical protein [Burkholderiaceae bacterium]